MSVDRAEVERIAALAHLRLDHGEAERLTAELNRILEHVAVLRGLGADPAPPPPAEGSPTRSAGDEPPDALALPPASFAPRWVDGFFVVPPPPGVHADDAGA